MHSQGFIFGQKGLRRTLAILGCVALLYFAAGGSLFHHHTGPDNDCSICHTLHMPVLGVAHLDLLPVAQHVSWHASLPQHVSPLDSFSPHRASRAPPQA